MASCCGCDNDDDRYRGRQNPRQNNYHSEETNAISQYSESWFFFFLNMNNKFNFFIRL